MVAKAYLDDQLLLLLFFLIFDILLYKREDIFSISADSEL